MNNNDLQNVATSSGPHKPFMERGLVLFKYLLRRFLGHAGYKRVSSQNWTASGMAIGGLGLTADLLQVFGSFIEIGLAVAGMSAVVFAFIILRRFRFCASFAAPFIFATIATLFFGSVVLAKSIVATPDDQGLIATILERLNQIDETTKRIETTVNQTAKDVSSTKKSIVAIEAQIEEILNQQLPMNGDINPATREAFESALRDLLTSSDARKQEAVTSILSGDVAAAARKLEDIAEDQSRSASATAHQAAKTWVEIAALKIRSDPKGAQDALTRAVRLEPGNKKAKLMLAGLAIQFGDFSSAFDLSLDLVGGDGTIPIWDRSDDQLGIRLAKPPSNVDDPDERRRIVQRIEREEELVVASALTLHGYLYFLRTEPDTGKKLFDRATRFTQNGRFPELAKIITSTRQFYDSQKGETLDRAFDELLAITDDQTSTAAERSAAFSQMAIIRGRQGSENDARRYFLEALFYYRENGDVLGEAALNRAVGGGIYSGGNRETGCKYIREAKNQYEAAGGDQWATSLDLLINLGCNQPSPQ